MRVKHCLMLLATLGPLTLESGTIGNNGRLDGPIYVEFAGTQEQIDRIKKYSSAHSLPISCEGRSSGFATLRVSIPRGTAREIIQGNFGGTGRVQAYKEQLVYPGMHVAKRCAFLPRVKSPYRTPTERSKEF
jgi:hypothetical protein